MNWIKSLVIGIMDRNSKVSWPQDSEFCGLGTKYSVIVLCE